MSLWRGLAWRLSWWRREQQDRQMLGLAVEYESSAEFHGGRARFHAAASEHYRALAVAARRAARRKRGG
ncbi:MAG: hypothetical protein AB1560_02025 [Pseudomonadota bacterium]